MPLKLDVAPHERILINGAVVQNGNRRVKWRFENFAQVMREKDILPESQATTPTRRLYFVVQQMYLDLENPDLYRDTFDKLAAQLAWAFTENPDAMDVLNQACGYVDDRSFYKALSDVRRLIRYEDLVFEYRSGPVAEKEDDNNKTVDG